MIQEKSYSAIHAELQRNVEVLDDGCHRWLGPSDESSIQEAREWLWKHTKGHFPHNSSIRMTCNNVCCVNSGHAEIARTAERTRAPVRQSPEIDQFMEMWMDTYGKEKVGTAELSSLLPLTDLGLREGGPGYSIHCQLGSLLRKCVGYTYKFHRVRYIERSSGRALYRLMPMVETEDHTPTKTRTEHSPAFTGAEWLDQASYLNGRAPSVAIHLWSDAETTGSYTVNADAALCRKAKLGRSTVYRAIKALENARLVTIKRYKGGAPPAVTIHQPGNSNAAHHVESDASATAEIRHCMSASEAKVIGAMGALGECATPTQIAREFKYDRDEKSLRDSSNVNKVLQRLITHGVARKSHRIGRYVYYELTNGYII
jgi:hypothetical protein